MRPSRVHNYTLTFGVEVSEPGLVVVILLWPLRHIVWVLQLKDFMKEPVVALSRVNKSKWGAACISHALRSPARLAGVGIVLEGVHIPRVLHRNVASPSGCCK